MTAFDQMDHGDDDFESEEEPTTLVARQTLPRSGKRTSPSKKPPRRTGPSNHKQRAQSAPGMRNSRDMWITAVKNHSNNQTLNGRRPPDSPRHKTPVEYWVNTLRKNRGGLSTESTGTFTGLRPSSAKNASYLSTTSFLRQMAGMEKGKNNSDDPTVRPSAGTPGYKTPEEYYDDVIEYKKQIVGIQNELSAVRAKLRRTEEDNIKKEKEIQQYLDPSKNEDIRRTLGNSKPDSAAVIQSLKQKILKLETQNRDKEAGYAKLQSELKTTNLEEMKVQMEVLFQEVIRLQNSKDVGYERNNKPNKEANMRVKALNETILRLNDTNQRLQGENKSLREDLQKSLDDHAAMSPSKHKNYGSMSKKELLSVIAKLERKTDRVDSRRTGSVRGDGDNLSLLSVDTRNSDRPGKITLEGNLEERLDALDRRETELLDELDKLKTTKKKKVPTATLR